MLGHVGINVPDLAGARRHYGTIMPLVGFELYVDADDEFAYRPPAGKPGTYLFCLSVGRAVPVFAASDRPEHLAFMVRTRSAVQRGLHRRRRTRARGLAGKWPHEPQVIPRSIRSRTSRPFWLDPLGRHARSGMPSRPRLTRRDEIRCADPDPADGSGMRCRSFRSDRCARD